MVYLMIGGSMLGAWVVLRTLGGERERRLQILRAEIEDLPRELFKPELPDAPRGKRE